MKPLCLRDDEAYHHLGSPQQVLNTKCKAHIRLITRNLGFDPRFSKYDGIRIYEYTKEDSISIVAMMGNSDSGSFWSNELRLLSPSCRAPTLRGRLVDPNWINYSLPRRWKSRCDKTHTCSSTHNIGRLVAERPLWVVDTWLQCIIPCSPSITYVALSYVWGDTLNFMTIEENVDHLQKPSSLAEGNTNPPISMTIRHAMSFIQKLGERYLWVDTLCIVQDNTQKSVEIAKMAAIFANASITIIASDGDDANSGLRGLPGISGPRSVAQTVHPLTRGVSVIEVDLSKYSDPTTWARRGWTLQEELFSRRRIFFEHNWVRWECECADWNEFYDANNRFVGYNIPAISAVAKEVPNVYDLGSLIQEYAKRELTFPEDSLLAFSGIASAISRTYDGFISGLPAILFYISLLWTPLEALDRRKPSHSGVNSCLPSWSWAGWKGRIWDWRALAEDLIKKSSMYQPICVGERVFPLVQWSWFDKQNGTRVCVRDRWYEYKEKFWNKFGATCPSGWTRHRIVDSENIPDGEVLNQPEPGAVPLCFYTHESEPESEFWYPLPSPEDSQPTKALTFAHFISCRTRRGWLVAGEAFSHRGRSSICLVSLRDQVGNWVGALLPHKPLNREVEVSIELVEVASGRVYGTAKDFDLGEWDLDERPKGGRIYEYYYVLWIEWEVGIAYRKGIGRVEKNMWERQEREWIDLVLG
ncbi:HET-domain-containing protein [Hypoxylon rubiginosum]|uniref:HET-domain-containing protein n=1 Tax=Hypoxylon rubiginosum TaxID=110542 RepID=A0ACB9ZD51_9PEZI|nr:HET-domain-containing protein [Hypoxylon rubiginosum]